jgi:hypothetical protein
VYNSNRDQEKQMNKKIDRLQIIIDAYTPEPIRGIGKLGEDSQQLKDLYEIQKMVENYQDSLIHQFYEKYPNII